MRDYGVVSPKFWIGGTGKALRGNPSAQIVALYLMTSPHANMIGVFYCPLDTIAKETGITLEGASEALRSLIEADFCRFDPETEEVFVVRMAAYQIGEALEPKDNRCKGVARELERVMSARLQSDFRAIYSVAFNLPPPVDKSAPELPKPEAPSEPLRSQKQDQEQKQDQGKPAQRKRSAPPAVPRPEDVTERTWADWLQLRKAKRAPVTETVVNGARAEAAKAGLDLEGFLQVWCRRGSQGLEAAWLRPDERGPARAPPAQSFAERDREAGMQRWEEMTGRVHPDRRQQPGAVVIDLPPQQPLAVGGCS